MVGIWLFKAWALLQLVLCVAVDNLPLECACCFGEIGDELSVCYPCSHSYHNDCIDLSQIAGFGLPDCPRYRNIFVRFLLRFDHDLEIFLLDLLRFDHDLFY